MFSFSCLGSETSSPSPPHLPHRPLLFFYFFAGIIPLCRAVVAPFDTAVVILLIPDSVEDLRGTLLFPLSPHLALWPVSMLWVGCQVTLS